MKRTITTLLVVIFALAGCSKGTTSTCQPLESDQLAAIADGLKPEYGGEITGESAWLPLPAESQTGPYTKIVAVGVDLGGTDETAIFATNDDQGQIQAVNATAFALFDWGSDFQGTDAIRQLRESDTASEVADCVGSSG